MQTGTRAEFAAHMNRNKSTVTRWADKGRLVFTDDGLVDFEKSIEMISKTADPAKHGVAERHAREREVIHPAAPSPPPAQPERLAAGAEDGTSYERFNEARALKEAENATLAKIKREELEGALIRRDDVKRDIESLAVIVSKGLTAIPARVMPLINGEADAGKREQILEAAVRQVLNELADAARDLVA